MRISDWSSDVCSSDLAALARSRILGLRQAEYCRQGRGHCRIRPRPRGRVRRKSRKPATDERHLRRAPIWGRGSSRSEEHTSELQSLMRISYAVFCLKKKKQTKNNTETKS